MQENDIDLFAEELGHVPLPAKPKKRREFDYKDGAIIAFSTILGIGCAHNHTSWAAAEKCLARQRRGDPENWGYIRDEEECEDKSTLVEIERYELPNGNINFNTGEIDKQYWEELAKKEGRGKHV